MLSFFGLFGGRPSSASARRRSAKPTPPRYFRPSLEAFEDRVVPASLTAPGQLAQQAALVAQQAAAAPALDITGVNLTNVEIVNGVLTAAGTVTGTLGGLPFTAVIEDFALQLPTQATECPVLDLELGPINLNVLGLHVDTSPICLEITATPGGGLLGDLLCGLAGGLPVVGPLSAGQVTGLQGGLTQILDGALGNAQARPGQGNNDVCSGECEVLNLVVGPLDLSVLGLNVRLDDCDDGPVQVCVSATAGEGLLGNLLCGLTGDRPLNLNLAEIAQLFNTANDLLKDGNLSGRDLATLRVLFNRLSR